MTSSSSSFHLFPLLPPEIRVQIWKWAFPAGQIVHILPSIGPGRRRPRNAPTVLRINRESRVEGLKHYHQSSEPVSIAGGFPMYFDPLRDVLHIKASSSRFRRDPLYQLKHYYADNWTSFRTLQISGYVSREHRFPNNYPLLCKAKYEFILELEGLEKIYVDYSYGHPRARGLERLDNWVLKFRAYLEENRERFNGGKAPTVHLGPSDAVGGRPLRDGEHSGNRGTYCVSRGV